jgi:hypothetical protein
MNLKGSPTVLVIEHSDEDLAAAEWSLKNSEDKVCYTPHEPLPYTEG